MAFKQSNWVIKTSSKGFKKKKNSPSFEADFFVVVVKFNFKSYQTAT